MTAWSLLDYIKITILGFALTALWSSLHSIILPLRLLDFVAESHKNTYLGLLTFTGLILAMVVQPVVGAISDRSNFSWGRRRPYILLGAMLAILFLPGIGLAGSVAILLTSYCLLQVSGNMAQGAFQAFIPELVHEKRRGRASGVKSLLEILGGIIVVRLIAYLMDHYYLGEGYYWLWLALGVLAAILLGTMLITVLTVAERPGAGDHNMLRLSQLYRSFKIDVRTNRNFVIFLISRGLMVIPGVTLQLFALYYLIDVVRVTDPVAVFGDLLVVIGVCLLVTVYPAGRLSDCIGRKPVIVSSGLLGAAGITSLLFSQDYVQLVVSGALLGIANGAFLSSSWALATDLVAKSEEARYLALTNLAMAGGSALARLIGPAIDFFNNINAGLGYRVMLLVGLTCFVVGALLILKIKPTSEKK